MGIYFDQKTKKWKVKSYLTGRYHKRQYKSRLAAEQAAGTKARKKYLNKKVQGASYMYVILIIVLFTLTLVYSILSTVVSWSFDVMIASPSFNLDRRYQTAEQMMRIFSAIPVAILLSLSMYAILRQLRERTF